MNWTETQNRLIGDWTGSNLLHLSWMNPTDYRSESRLSVSPVVRGKFLSVTYTWSHENVPHEGMILIGYDVDRGEATAGWIDSWHQSARVMVCEGSIDEEGSIFIRGSYEAPPGPDWGWRITIAPKGGNGLQMVMYNITPEGEEDLAVQADYTRAA